MHKLVIAVSLALLVSACGSKNDGPSTTTTTATTTTATNTTTTTTTPSSPAKNAALEVMKQWGTASNAADWDKLKSLYAADAVLIAAGMPKSVNGPDAIVKFFKSFRASFPDLKAWPSHAFVKGNTVASIAILKGTNTKSFLGSKATNKQVSFVAFELAEIKNGKIAKQTLYADNLNFFGQLGISHERHRPVWEGQIPVFVTAIASDSATEKTNLSVVTQLIKHFNAHEAMKAVALYTPSAWLDDQSAPKRVGGNGNILKELKNGFAMFPDLSLKDPNLWAAGDFVVATYTYTGSNTGSVPNAPATNKNISIPAASVFRLDNGKVAMHWVFMDGMAVRMQLGVRTLRARPGAQSK